MSNEDKRYGLLLPKKAQLSAPKPSNIFGDNDDSDEDEGTDWVRKALKGSSNKTRVKKQTQLDMQKALKEDPTIYQYDEVYDDIERKKIDVKTTKKEIKKPKYIENLLKTAERRKIEQEHRIERMVQKEREAEGSMYADKESFVTSAYRAKLEEFKKLEEEEKRMDRLEAIGDVTKQKDMSGFYRHLYRQTVDNVKTDETEDKAKGSKNNELEKCDLDIDKDSCMSSESDSEASTYEDKVIKETAKKVIKLKKKRQYRKRAINTSESESEPEPADDEKKKKKEDNDEEFLKKEEPKISLESDKKKQKIVEIKVKGKDEDSVKDKLNSSQKSSEKSNIEKDSIDENSSIDKPIVPKKKVSIWEKRTVGPVFEAALQRYYERKALRLSGV